MIVALGKLVRLRARSPAGSRLALACGCFDLLTAGHVRHLKAARAKADRLCVLVTADRHVNKGAGRPVFPEGLRAEVVAALSCVDYVVVNPHPTAADAIRLLRPQVYVKGGEYQGRPTPALVQERVALAEVGGGMVFTDTAEAHTTDVLRRLGLCE